MELELEFELDLELEPESDFLALEFESELELEPESPPPEDLTDPLAYTGCSMVTVRAATATMARITVIERIVRNLICIAHHSFPEKRNHFEGALSVVLDAKNTTLFQISDVKRQHG